jgi:CheY-like chemotaxis protein
MLAYAGKGRLNEVVVLFDSMVEEIATLVRLSVPKTVPVLYDLRASGACLRCNQTQLQQVVMNLVINAAEASQVDPQPVEVITYSRTFEASELIDSVSTAEMCEPGEYVVFEVQDHGTGMSDETLERCFEPFFSTKFTGRGLGLAAVHGIVRAHQGLLKVRTELGKGTNFQVYLPRCFEDPDVRDVVTSVPTYSGIGRKVLVIDDDPMVRKIMVRMLKRIGYEVVSEESGEKGIECLTESDGKFHVVIVDMEMPGKNGLAVGKIIRERWSHLPLVLSSGYSQDLIQDGGPFDAFIQKPYTLTSMATTVNSVALDPDGLSSP